VNSRGAAFGQIDDAAVEAHQLILETKLLAATPRGHLRLAFLQHLTEDRLVEFPRAVLVGIGQGGFLGRFALRRRFTARQAHADLTQGLQLRHLAEQHRHELPPAGEAFDIPLRRVLRHRPRDLPSRKQLQ
jgi:hypothetical protein